MPIVNERASVLETYADAAHRGWLIPCFGTENLTCTEAILSATLAHGKRIGCPNLPVTIAMTVNYRARPQARCYTQTGDAELGLRLFLADIQALMRPPSVFSQLRVLVHLDHVQPEIDGAVLGSDLSEFSSIMFDATNGSWEQNIQRTRDFVRHQREKIVIEGGCDSISDSGHGGCQSEAAIERVEQFVSETGVDMVVADLGTEHRASQSSLEYRRDLARAISARVGKILVLHGCSSVDPSQLTQLAGDGICKVNVWTALERDASPALLEEMVAHASEVAGSEAVRAMKENSCLGSRVDSTLPAKLPHLSSHWRQEIVFNRMVQITESFLGLWYR